MELSASRFGRVRRLIARNVIFSLLLLMYDGAHAGRSMIRLYRVSQAPGVRPCRVDHAARVVSDGASVIIVAMADADQRPHVARAKSGGHSIRRKRFRADRACAPGALIRVFRAIISSALICSLQQRSKTCRLISQRWNPLRVNMRNPILVSAD